MRKSSRFLGAAFSDQLKRARPGKIRNIQHLAVTEWVSQVFPELNEGKLNNPVSIWRVIVVACLSLVSFFILFVRAFDLQILNGEHNRDLANSNRVQVRTIHAPRGIIYDRNGKVLAENDPGFRLAGKIISREQALNLEAKNDPKFNQVEIDSIRSYPYASLTAHILGYLGEISEGELKQPQFTKLHFGDQIGRAGIEQMYEGVLRGRDGAEIVEVDAQGVKLTTIRRIEPVPGNNLYVSIDVDLQKWASLTLESTLVKTQSCCGALVAEDPATGEVLTLLSYPGFDPNNFTHPSFNQQVKTYFEDSHAPLLNRVTAGTYPPGSTFKIVTALSGLENQAIDAKTQFEDTGVVNLGPFSFSNWYFSQYGRTEGWVDIVKALKRSNDTYFYKVGAILGVEKMAQTAKKLGFGRELGIDIPGETAGLIPSSKWKQDNFSQPWYPGDDLHMAIGQGFVLATPLQVLNQTAVVANGGKSYSPHLVKRITSPSGDLITEKVPHINGSAEFKLENIRLVQAGMAEVNKPGGTAWPFFDFSVPSAGKTGTAEFGDSKNRTHAWYTAYAPFDSPKIALVVLVEAGGEGSNTAAPIAKQIFTWFFNSDKAHLKSLDQPIQASEDAKKLGE